MGRYTVLFENLLIDVISIIWPVTAFIVYLDTRREKRNASVLFAFCGIIGCLAAVGVAIFFFGGIRDIYLVFGCILLWALGQFVLVILINKFV